MITLVYGIVVILVALLALIAVLACLALRRSPGQYFDAGGVRLFYRVEGQGTPVILVHGYGVNADLNWRLPGVVRALRGTYRVIRFDLRGHGRSDKPKLPEQYGKEAALDVIRLMDHLGIAKAHVVGYSMGGFITIHLIARHPERLLSAVPCASGFEKAEGKNLETLRTLTESLDRHEGYGPLLRALEPETPPAWRINLVSFLMSAINDNDAMSAIMKRFTDLAITEEEMRNNRVPVLSIAGTRDPLGAGIKTMTEVMGNHEAVYIENGDHATTLLNKAYLKHLRAFLAKHTPENHPG